MLRATLCFPVRGNPAQSVLLGWKKRGLGQDQFAGFGGKIEGNEPVVDAACRELAEESGLLVNPATLEAVAVCDFFFPNKPSWEQQVHVFITRQWAGEPRESDEMRPQWFEVSQIPFERMWHDNRFWLPPLLAGKKLRARFTYQPDNQTVEIYKIENWEI